MWQESWISHKLVIDLVIKGTKQLGWVGDKATERDEEENREIERENKSRVQGNAKGVTMALQFYANQFPPLVSCKSLSPLKQIELIK